MSQEDQNPVPKRVSIVVFRECDPSIIYGVFDTLWAAGRFLKGSPGMQLSDPHAAAEPLFEPRLVAAEHGPLELITGVSIIPQDSIEDIETTDIVFVPKSGIAKVNQAIDQYVRKMLPFSLDLRPLGGHAPGPRLFLCHGTPVLNTVYWTEDRPDDFCRKMATGVELKAGDVLAFGHTHKPWHRVVDGVHFVNTGSVGRPKDGDWRAGYILLDLGEGEPRVQFVRVGYDIDATVSGVRAAGLPDEFAEFLRTGGKPAA